MYVSGKCSAISHVIMSAEILHIYASGRSCHIHPQKCGSRELGSRKLIDMLSALGLSERCHEVEQFITAQLQENSPVYSMDGLVWFVFNNADFNIAMYYAH